MFGRKRRREQAELAKKRREEAWQRFNGQVARAANVAIANALADARRRHGDSKPIGVNSVHFEVEGEYVRGDWT